MRLVLYSNLAIAWGVLQRWAATADHEVALLVTSPRGGRSEAEHLEALGVAESEVPLAVVKRASDAGPAVAEAGADLGIVYAFQRVPKDLARVPAAGTVNLHPTLLPAYRGPNGFRAIFEGEPQFGSTLHWLAEEFDAGAILAQSTCTMPDEVDPRTVWEAWERTMIDVLDAGVPLAVEQAPGDAQPGQDTRRATDFELRDLVLDRGLDVRTFCCRGTALLLAEQQPLVRLPAGRRQITDLRVPARLDEPSETGWERVELSDGAVEVQV